MRLWRYLCELCQAYLVKDLLNKLCTHGPDVCAVCSTWVCHDCCLRLHMCKRLFGKVAAALSEFG